MNVSHTNILHSHSVRSETAREFRLMKIICFTTIYFMSLPFEHCRKYKSRIMTLRIWRTIINNM